MKGSLGQSSNAFISKKRFTVIQKVQKSIQVCHNSVCEMIPKIIRTFYMWDKELFE